MGTRLEGSQRGHGACGGPARGARIRVLEAGEEGNDALRHHAAHIEQQPPQLIHRCVGAARAKRKVQRRAGGALPQRQAQQVGGWHDVAASVRAKARQRHAWEQRGCERRHGAQRAADQHNGARGGGDGREPRPRVQQRELQAAGGRAGAASARHQHAAVAIGRGERGQEGEQRLQRCCGAASGPTAVFR